ncbi:hypothetical protein [Erysipelothrix sp. HDW6C]|nr:hypothetical protein [Erysipelothrix sp. HDW6C]
MFEFLGFYAPNLITYWDEFILGIIETLYMLAVSGFFSIVFGIILG